MFLLLFVYWRGGTNPPGALRHLLDRSVYQKKNELYWPSSLQTRNVLLWNWCITLSIKPRNSTKHKNSYFWIRCMQVQRNRTLCGKRPWIQLTEASLHVFTAVCLNVSQLNRESFSIYLYIFFRLFVWFSCCFESEMNPPPPPPHPHGLCEGFCWPAPRSDGLQAGRLLLSTCLCLQAGPCKQCRCIQVQQAAAAVFSVSFFFFPLLFFFKLFSDLLPF